MSTVVDDRTLCLTRIFDAPRERVFEAWTDAEQFAEWIGMPATIVNSCDLDVRPGGAWHVQGHKGHIPTRSFAVSGKYLEVKKPEKLSFTWAHHEKGELARPRGHETVVTVTFKALGSKTELTLVHGAFADATDAGDHNRGWDASFAKLDALLRRTA